MIDYLLGDFLRGEGFLVLDFGGNCLVLGGFSGKRIRLGGRFGGGGG